MSGRLSSHSTIWGVSIFWWGRLGKMMQFVGAATIIADIIGPERIRQFGASLQNTVTSIVLIQFLKDCFRWYVLIFRHTLMKDYDDNVTTPKRRFNPSRLDILNGLISILLTALIFSLVEIQPLSWIVLIEAIVIFGCLLVSISPILTVLTIVSLILMELLVNSVAIKPLAWMLEHPSLDRLTKLVSLLLLLLGFHFELLAS